MSGHGTWDRSRISIETIEVTYFSIHARAEALR
jgi:hypothetical protein